MLELIRVWNSQMKDTKHDNSPSDMLVQLNNGTLNFIAIAKSNSIFAFKFIFI